MTEQQQQQQNIYLNPFAVHLKLTQHRKSTLILKKIKKQLMDLAGLHQVAISGEALVDLVWETLGSLFKTIFHTLRMAVSA